MSVEKGFNSGCGAVFGVVVGIILLIVALRAGRQLRVALPELLRHRQLPPVPRQRQGDNLR